MDDTELAGTIAALYGASLDARRWDAALGRIAAACEARAVHLFFWDTLLDRPLFDAAAGADAAARAEVLQAAHEYQAHWGILDYRRRLSSHTPAGAWFQCHEHFDARRVRREAFFNDYLRRWNFRWLAGMHVLSTGRLRAHLGVQRGFEQTPLDARDMQLLASLGHHVAAAARLFLEAEDLRATAGLSQELFHAWSMPALLLDENLHIAFANRGAEALLRRPVGLRVRAGHLEPTLLSRRRELQAAVRCAVRDSRSRTMTWRGGPAPGLTLAVYPIAAQDAASVRQAGPRALVTIVDSQPVQGDHARALRQVHGLSAREAEVALALAAGQSPGEIADMARVSINTVRSQVRAVFRKCQVTRVTQLAALVAALQRVSVAQSFDNTHQI